MPRSSSPIPRLPRRNSKTGKANSKAAKSNSKTAKPEFQGGQDGREAAAPSRVLGAALNPPPARSRPPPSPRSPFITASLPPATTEAPAPAAATTVALSAHDLAAVEEAVSLARSGKSSRATEVQSEISDPAARKLIEWAILKSDENDASFKRYAAFINGNPGWPATGLLHRRAEAMLWQEHANLDTIRNFLGKEYPLTTKGKFALARALLLQGDRTGAQSLVREAWRNDSFSSELENPALDVFQDLITSADHKARMDMRLYAEDVDGALRSANRAAATPPPSPRRASP